MTANQHDDADFAEAMSGIQKDKETQVVKNQPVVAEENKSTDAVETDKAAEEVSTVPADKTTVGQQDKPDNIESVKAPAFNEDEYVTKKTGGKYKKWDELEAQINREVKPEFADPLIEKMNEARRNGVPVEKLIKIYSTDYTKLSDTEKVREGILLESPELTKEEVDFLINSRYKTSVDEDSDDSVKEQARLASILLKQEAKKYEKMLLDNQQKELSVPVDPKRAEAEARAEEERIKTENYEKWWSDRATEAANDYKEIKVKIGEGEQDVFSYVPDANDLNFAKEVTKNPEKLMGLFRDKDGSVNHKKLIDGIARLASTDKLNKGLVEAIKAKAIEEYLKDKKNVDFRSNGNSGGHAQQKSTRDTNLDKLSESLL